MTDIPKAPKGFWTCAWWGFGNIDRSQAFRPDSEKPVIDGNGDPICTQCAEMWWREREKSEK